MVLSLRPLDWESSTLTTRPLLTLINLEINQKEILLLIIFGDIFLVPIVLDCYHFGSGCDNVMCYFVSLCYGPKLISL